MKVLRVVTRLNVGGPSRHALILHRGLREAGWDVVLAAGSSEGAEGDLTDWDPEEVVRVPGLRRGAGPPGAARATRFLRGLIAEHQPDIVHSHLAMAGFCARAAAGALSPRRASGGRRASRSSASGASAGRPVLVHTFHGHVLEGYFSKRREQLYANVERVLALRTDALLAVSPQIRDELAARRIGRTRWHVVPVGLHLDDLLSLPGGADRAEAGDRLRRVGVVGRLVPIKDHDTLLHAILRLPPDVTLVVAGDGELRAELETLTRRIALAGRVEFRGWVRDLPGLYGDLDVVCLSSRNEGTPVALIEAMAAGRPVVASAVGGVPDVVTHGVNGLLVPPGDPDALGAALMAILEDPGLARSMGLAGREAVRDRFDARRLVSDVDALYRSLLAGRDDVRDADDPA